MLRGPSEQNTSLLQSPSTKYFQSKPEAWQRESTSAFTITNHGKQLENLSHGEEWEQQQMCCCICYSQTAWPEQSIKHTHTHARDKILVAHLLHISDFYWNNSFNSPILLYLGKRSQTARASLLERSNRLLNGQDQLNEEGEKWNTHAHSNNLLLIQKVRLFFFSACTVFACQNITLNITTCMWVVYSNSSKIKFWSKCSFRNSLLMQSFNSARHG